jgi:hypothetical protein
VEDRTVLRGVDPVAAKHPVAPLFDTPLAGEFEEERHCLPRDPVLRVVEEDLLPANGVAGEAVGIGGEEVPHVEGTNLTGMGAKNAPDGEGRRR